MVLWFASLDMKTYSTPTKCSKPFFSVPLQDCLLIGIFTKVLNKVYHNPMVHIQHIELAELGSITPLAARTICLFLASTHLPTRPQEFHRLFDPTDGQLLDPCPNQLNMQ